MHNEVTKENRAINRDRIIRKIVRLLETLIDWTIVIFILLLFSYGAYALWDTKQVYQEAEAIQYSSYKPTVENTLSFEQLKRLNKDVFGWITLYGTHIDYPLLQAEDNDKYVNTNSLGEYSLAGSIFLDYRNKKDFSDYNTIIYGHHMDKNAMFGEIGNFEDESYFNEHKYGNLYYEGKNHGIEFFAFMQVDAYDFDIFTPAIKEKKAQKGYLQSLLNHSLYTRNIGLKSSDRIVLLYTCSSDITNGRNCLIGRITDKVYSDTFQTEETKNMQYIEVKNLKEFLEQLPIWQKVIGIITLVLLVIVVYHKIRSLWKKIKQRRR